MKKYILRAPETDRKGVSVPDALTDFPDYIIAHGAGTAAAPQLVEAVQTNNLATTSTRELVNVTAPSGVLTVGVAGLFICIVTMRQTWNPVAAPNYKRGVGVSKNGAASFEDSVLYDSDSTGAVEFDDQASFFVRLAAGDSLQPRFQNYMAGSVNVIATISLHRIAP